MNRRGIEESFPCISISIVGLPSKEFTSIDMLAEDAAALKKHCKLRTGSNYIIRGAHLDVTMQDSVLVL